MVGSGFEFWPEHFGGCLRVQVTGELDLTSGPRLVAAVEPRIRYGVRAVWLDLSELTFCDVRGLRALLDLEEVLAAEGGRLILHDPCRQVARLLAMTGLAEHFAID